MVEEKPQADGEKHDQSLKSSEDQSELILGICPLESQGAIGPFNEISELVVEGPEMISLRSIEIVLAGLTIAAALLAGILRKRKK